MRGFEVPGIAKWAVALGVLGVLGYDGFMTVATHLKAETDAQNAAYAASQAYFNAEAGQRTAETAYQAALTYLAGDQAPRCTAELTDESRGTTPTVIPLGCDFVCTGASAQASQCGTHGMFTIDGDGTVHLIVRRQAKTLVFGHLGFLHSMLVAYEQGDANQEQD
jgi:hypothetical protein